MKIYVVLESWPYEGSDVVGVFTSLQSAKIEREVKLAQPYNSGEVSIHMWNTRSQHVEEIE